MSVLYDMTHWWSNKSKVKKMKVIYLFLFRLNTFVKNKHTLAYFFFNKIVFITIYLYVLDT